MQSQAEVRDQPPPGPPPPPEQGARLPWRWIVTALMLGFLVWAAFNVPIPVVYAYEPGPARDVEKLVEVSGERTYSSDGSLYLTTVRVDINVTVVEWIEAAIDPAKLIVSKNEVTGGRSFDRLEEIQLQQMESSKEQARVVALNALGYPPPTGDGAKILDVQEQSPAGGTLETDDVITSVNGSDVETTCDASQTIGAVEIGDEVELTVLRDGKERNLSLTTAENPEDPSKAYVGVFMTNKGFEYDPGVDVKFATGEIAGPSAGLMFSLTLYDQLTPEDLTGGRQVAGTGTIGCGGEVGAIGGIEQKVAGAEGEGADVFLAPSGNYEAALAVADDIEVVEVATFQDALDFLEGS